MLAQKTASVVAPTPQVRGLVLVLGLSRPRWPLKLLPLISLLFWLLWLRLFSVMTAGMSSPVLLPYLSLTLMLLVRFLRPASCDWCGAFRGPPAPGSASSATRFPTEVEIG